MLKNKCRLLPSVKRMIATLHFLEKQPFLKPTEKGNIRHLLLYYSYVTNRSWWNGSFLEGLGFKGQKSPSYVKQKGGDWPANQGLYIWPYVEGSPSISSCYLSGREKHADIYICQFVAGLYPAKEIVSLRLESELLLTCRSYTQW